jgi:hypothetical protein
MRHFIFKHKYELLLFALLQHLYIGILVTNLDWYTRILWPVSMVVLGIACSGLFINKGRSKNLLFTLFTIIVFALPIILPWVEKTQVFMQVLSTAYIFFFLFLLWELMRFLLRPGYINHDLLSAAACGYFLLIEISVFLMQVMYYHNPASFNNVSASNPSGTYIDLVYFCTITQSTIGYGDISPNAHYTKLAASLFGVAGQFYSVVLIGILLSKYASKSSTQ